MPTPAISIAIRPANMPSRRAIPARRLPLLRRLPSNDDAYEPTAPVPRHGRTRMEERSQDAWQPQRERIVSPALQSYAALTTCAAHGAVRDVTRVTLAP